MELLLIPPAWTSTSVSLGSKPSLVTRTVPANPFHNAAGNFMQVCVPVIVSILGTELCLRREG